uniref:WDR5-like beta-propeller domain-containing protein n=1 Tax=Lotharella oceanica TaxID=641309 RepID=A0A7S2U3F1_9EUKA
MDNCNFKATGTKLMGHSRAITCLEFSPDGQFLASGSADCTVKIWNFKSGKLHKSLEEHTAGINAVAWGGKSGALCTASDDGRIFVYNVKTWKIRHKLLGHQKPVFCVDMSNDESLIVSGGMDNKVRIWSSRSGRCEKILPGHVKPVTAVAFNPEPPSSKGYPADKLIVSSGYDGLCRIWETETGHLLKTIISNDSVHPAVGNADFAPNNLFVLISTHDGRVSLWDIKSSECKWQAEGHQNSRYCTSSKIWPIFKEKPVSNKQPLIVCGSEDGKVYIWHQDKTLLARLQHSDSKEDVVLAVACHPSEAYVATGSLNKPGIRLWKTTLWTCASCGFQNTPWQQSCRAKVGDQKKVCGKPRR